MKRINIFSTALTAAALALLVACSDDFGVKTYNDGFLHFKFLFDKQGAWKEDGTTGSKTRMMLPIEMELPEGFDTPLYLHCVAQNSIEPAVETRGERITGEVFDDRNKIKCFGLYAVVGGEEVLSVYSDPDNMTGKQSSFTEISRSSLTESGDWQIRNQDLIFSDGESMWSDSKTGNFYGFAPFPGWDGDTEASYGRTRCITVNTDNHDAPTITFTMQPEEEYNKDILTAKKTGVTSNQKGSGIELEFKHVLSALKFNLDATNDMKYTVGINGTEYYLQIKSITVEGIYDQGTAGIGEMTWTLESTTGSCTSVLNRSYSDVTGDANKLINTDEKCMMVLPQTAPTGAKLIITADLTSDAAGATAFKEDVTFEAGLAGLTWEAGHTYTYQISKDSRATNYTLTSTNGRVDNAFQFEANGDVTSGYPVDFDVTSYAEFTDGSSTTTSPAAWHVEYSDDNGATWKEGLPFGFSIINKATGAHVVDLSSIPGSETPVTYTLEADVRLDGSPAVTSLTGNDYNQYAGTDGYYDLSLHNLGFSPTICGQTTARNTANCYIVNGYGKFKIPLVYGNGMKQGLENPKAYQYAWEENTTYDASGLTYPAGHDVFCDHNGNQINHSWLSAQLGHPLSSAEIVWQDHDNIVRSNSVKLDDTKENYLLFEIRKEDIQPGNLVLAVKDGADIAWSWHIWVTVNTDFAQTTTVSHTFNSTTYTMDVAKYSLGWTEPIIKNNIGTKAVKFRVIQNDKMGKNVEHEVSQNGGIVSSENSSLIYQNGRKDPFPNYGLKVASASIDGSGNITATYTKEDLFTKVSLGITDHARSNSEYTPKYCHKNPNSYVMATMNWFIENGLKTNYNRNQAYECWNPEGNSNRGSSLGTLEDNYKTHTKTIYDPCPVGFMVPNSGIIQMLLNDTPFTAGTTIDIDDQGHTATAPYNYVETASGIRFYTTGGRRVNTSATDYIRDPSLGYFWTAATFSNGLYGMYFQTNGSAIQNQAVANQRTVSSGFSVRPIRDDQQETVAAWASEPVKNFHEATALGVELTRYGSTTNYGIADLSSVNVHIQGGSNVTLASIINDSGNTNKKLLLKNIHVEFDYNGYSYVALLGRRTLDNYSITYLQERHGQGAYTLLADIPDFYTFCSDWLTKYSDQYVPVSSWNWEEIVPLTTSKVNITRVTADLRVSYTTD